MISKEIEIDGKLVPFKASAAIPRLYRARFRRDIFRDLMRLGKAVEGEEVPIRDLELFENVAYIMALHADPKQPGTPEEWLDQFNTFSIYTVLPQLLDLWHLNIETDVEAKKKTKPSSREMTTPLFMLRAVQLGVAVSDLDMLTIGLVLDMFTESQNDSYKYPNLATQEDFDKF